MTAPVLRQCCSHCINIANHIHVHEPWNFPKLATTDAAACKYTALQHRQVYEHHKPTVHPAAIRMHLPTGHLYQTAVHSTVSAATVFLWLPPE